MQPNTLTSRLEKSVAGAPGFEPGMPVPKTGALPLGDAPTGQIDETPLPERRLIIKAGRQRQ